MKNPPDVILAGLFLCFGPAYRIAAVLELRAKVARSF
jgi:hypothetical protein